MFGSSLTRYFLPINTNKPYHVDLIKAQQPGFPGIFAQSLDLAWKARLSHQILPTTIKSVRPFIDWLIGLNISFKNVDKVSMQTRNSL